ncbi:MAG: putative glycoside hydrolase [Candidatus Bipolaricaulota bacterium]
MRRKLLLTLALLLGVVGFLSWEGGTPRLQDALALPEEEASSSIHNRRGVYLSCYAASRSGYLEKVLEMCGRWGLDTVVIDVKNNHGELSYASEVPLAREVGAVSPRLDLVEVVGLIHSKGIYAVARQVVYHDPKLARHLRAPGGEWVPAGDSTADSYNLDIAREVAAAGFDELQFDYVRFPDDGMIGEDYSDRCRAVEGFLARAKEALDVPISVDLFGRVLWPWNAREIDPIGQHLESMTSYVEVFSPMLYPSHYSEEEFKSDPYRTVRQALEAGASRTDVPVRPYLQAFDRALPAGVSLAQYIAEQVRAAEDVGADGYLFWNPRSNYEALWEALHLLDAP